ANNETRPIWMSFAGTEQMCRMFAVNLLKGKKASVANKHGAPERFNFLKTAKFQIYTKRVPGGSVTTIYYPPLFWTDPGMVDPEKIEFVFLPPKAWLGKQNPDTTGVLEMLSDDHGIKVTPELAKSITTYALMSRMYLDRRCRFPIPQGNLFAVKLFVASLHRGYAYHPAWSSDRSRWSAKHTQDGFKDFEIPDAVSFSANHDQIADLLSVEVKAWQERNQ
ncbi:MAG: hypothetical protein LAT68_16830, partial [Cyclobacteriaceae bacterium]|nr:hypothetical protein [Cyclobacteriaceae bacterium]